MKKISYRQFYNVLKADDYTDKEILHLFREVKKMDPEVRGWLINWFYGEGMPDAVVEDVTAQNLMSELSMKPIAAFIALDWLKKSPDEAKYGLMNLGTPLNISEETVKEMEQILQEMGAESGSQEGGEDLSDIEG